MKAFCVMFVLLAVLLLPAPLASAQDGWAGCPWGFDYNPMSYGYVEACINGPAPVAPAASKSAGLAKPAPTVIPVQGLPCLPWGDAYDLVTMLSHGPECLSQPTDNATAAKSAGLAKLTPLTPVEEFIPCGNGGRLDLLTLACQQ